MRYLRRPADRGWGEAITTRRLRSAACLAAALLAPWVAGAAERRLAEPREPDVRVRLRAAAPGVRFEGPGLRLDGRPIASGALRVTREGAELSAAGKRIGRLVTVSGGPRLQLDGRTSPGRYRLVAAGAGIDVVRLVPLERYVAATLAGEIYPSWPLEVLKAQAVATRSYVLHERARQVGRSFDVERSVISQAYRPEAKAAPSIASAVEATRGQTLRFGGSPILAAFHSSAGGRTASAHEVWGEPRPYLLSVDSPDETSPDFFWSYSIPLGDLRAALAESGFEPGPLDAPGALEIVERSASGRVAGLRVGGVTLRGRDLRQILGGRALKSTRFDARVEGGAVTFLGSGAGHGVGLCQWGARELARQGKSFREILAHYYPGAELSNGRVEHAGRARRRGQVSTASASRSKP